MSEFETMNGRRERVIDLARDIFLRTVSDKGVTSFPQHDHMLQYAFKSANEFEKAAAKYISSGKLPTIDKVVDPQPWVNLG